MAIILELAYTKAPFTASNLSQNPCVVLFSQASRVFRTVVEPSQKILGT